MALASSSRVQVAYSKETVFGVTDAAAPSKNLRATSENLAYGITKETSAELNKNRGSSSMVPVSGEASGPVSGELSYGEWDEFMAATLQADAGWVASEGTALTVTVTPTSIDSVTAVPSWATLTRGQWFVLGGAVANAGKLFRVSKITAPTTNKITLDAATPGVAETVTGIGVTSAARISNGTLQDSFSIERQILDVTEFFNYRGMTAASMNLTMGTGAITTVEFNFMGRDLVAKNVTQLKTPALNSFAEEVMSGGSGTVCGVYWKGAALVDTFVNSLTLSYDNALRMQNALCSLGAIGIGAGTIALSVETQMYFGSGRKFFDEFLKNESNELAFTAFDVNGNGYVMTLPKANVSTYTVNAGGKDQDLLVTVNFTGLLDMTNAIPALRGKLLFIDRTGKAPVRPT